MTLDVGCTPTLKITGSPSFQKTLLIDSMPSPLDIYKFESPTTNKEYCKAVRHEIVDLKLNG
jgi:hypothetical protein